MEELIGSLIGVFLTLGIPAILIVLGLVVGRAAEKKHLNDLARREVNSGDMLATQTKSFFAATRGATAPTLIVAEVVIGADYLKSVLGGLMNLFGGEINPFQTLLDRARREALMRVKEQAREMGYNAVCNVRMENADIGGRDPSRSKIVFGSILVSATAYHARIDTPSEGTGDQPIAATLV